LKIALLKGHTLPSYEDLVNAYEAREAAALQRKQARRQRYEDAAREAHMTRNMGRFLQSVPRIEWEDLSISSQRHFIADAENVALNPSITAIELARLYKERLIAVGDTNSPDLDGEDEIVEAMVLDQLKRCLADIDDTQSDQPTAT
jgi:hypothetical protein